MFGDSFVRSGDGGPCDVGCGRARAAGGVAGAGGDGHAGGNGGKEHLVAVSNFESLAEVKGLPQVGDYQTTDWEARRGFGRT